ncbi:hypothetical protein [Bradyrhizobium sp. Ash2021]|uniref:hypothetical protein n=1 Tax=Bradyrhizobium sp. Ash2021 TaxID=2954771 RepID=UPI00281506F8|nr:hypothetical protein [Bradyrhizobium sp. Ash2021]WMT77453.1 hypothetical protein NL528_14335 [Bradyrhizobium sp. Ash2021]
MDELTAALGPVMPQTLAEHPAVVERIFESVFNAHGIVAEHAGRNVLQCVPRILANPRCCKGKLNDR